MKVSDLPPVAMAVVRIWQMKMRECQVVDAKVLVLGRGVGLSIVKGL